MPGVANPLHDEWAFGTVGTPAYNNNANATAGAVAGPSPAASSAAASLQGTPPLTGAHNTPLHIALVGVLAVLLLWGLHAAGFRFGAAVEVRG